MTTEKGKYYWGIKVPKNISIDEEMFVFGDKFEVIEGNLIFTRNDLNIFSLSKGNWNVVYAASVWDGHACYIEHWKNQFNDKENMEKL